MKTTMLVGSDGNSAYSVTDSTRNITITGLPFTLEAKHVAYIFNITQKLLLFAPIDGFESISVSGGVITYSSTLAALATGDLLHIQLYPPNYGTDEDGYGMFRLLNPPPRPNTSPEHLVSEEDQVVDTVNRYVVPWQDVYYGSIHAKLFADTADDSVTMTVWATNNADADDTADDNWVNISTSVLGAASLEAINETEEEVYFIDTEMVFLKMMIRIEYGLSSSGITENNSADVYIVKA